jgi:hypothetical protein
VRLTNSPGLHSTRGGEFTTVRSKTTDSTNKTALSASTKYAATGCLAPRCCLVILSQGVPNGVGSQPESGPDGIWEGGGRMDGDSALVGMGTGSCFTTDASRARYAV